MMFGPRLKTIRRHWRIILDYALLVLLLLLVYSQSQAQSFSDEFDQYFRDSATRYLYGYLPDDDWRWWKAQCYQESRIKADAVSPAGAAGVCQLMATAAQDARLNWNDRFNAEKNIKAGAFILRRGIRTWWPRPTRLDRLRLGWACYNAGCGHIIRAQSKCDDARLWEEIAPCLPQITGRHADETIHYVEIIPRWYQRIR